MYEAFYGFRKKPFQIAPDPAFLYKSPKHEAALAYLEYGVTENAGFILLTGEIGSGKTTLVQYILGRLSADTEAAVIFNTTVSAEELLGLILEELGLPRTPGDKAAHLSALNRCLIDRYAHGKRVLLVIDEAQNLSNEALEEVRMLSNLQAEGQPLLQIMLVGQPELITTLSQPALRQFTQRIAASYHLTGLSLEETGSYLAHRLQTAGGRPDLFTEAALGMIYELSGGIPRSINLLGQAALVYGFAQDAPVISQDLIRAIREDNVGIYLPAALPAPVPAAPADPPAADGNGALSGRLALLEGELRGVQERVNETIRRLDEQRGRAEEELLTRLKALLAEERQRNDALLKRCLKLTLENRYLRNQRTRKKPDAQRD